MLGNFHDFVVIEIKLATGYWMKNSYLAIIQENAFLCHNLDPAHTHIQMIEKRYTVDPFSIICIKIILLVIS